MTLSFTLLDKGFYKSIPIYVHVLKESESPNKIEN